MTTAPRTTPAVLDRIARELADHDAVVTAARTLTFADLRREVRQAAAAMIDLGVEPGDRVAIWSPNTWHWVVACLATHYAGGVLVPLNTRYTASEATDILARTAAPLLFASGEFLGADKAASLDRDALPALRHIVRIPDRQGRRHMGRVRRPGHRLRGRARRAPRPSAPTTCPTFSSPPAPPGAARACGARTGSRSTPRRPGRRAASSPAPTATCASTRSSTTSATRPASWRACRPAPRCSPS